MATPSRLSRCEFLRYFCWIRPSFRLLFGVALTVLSAQCTEFNSSPITLPSICATTARTTQPNPQPATTTQRRHKVYHHREIGSVLDPVGRPSVRLTLQPVSTLFRMNGAQLFVCKSGGWAVLGSRLSGSLMRCLHLRGGADGWRSGRGPQASRNYHSRQSSAGRSTSRSQTRLHPDLERCQTLDDWCSFINAKAGQLDAASTAGAFKWIVRLKRFSGRNEQLRSPLSRLSERASAIAGQMTGNEIGDIFWVHGKMQLRMHETLWETLGRQAIASAEAFSAKNVANTVWSLAKAGRRCKLNRALISAMSERAIGTSHAFDPQNIANVMWALATMGLRADVGLVMAMSGQAMRTAGEFKPQNVANLMWAYATMGLRAEAGLVSAMSKQAIWTAGEFDPQAIANLMWAYATMGLQAEAELVSAMSARATRIAD
eukprot:3937284-Rhodomonas_salina.1